MINCRLFYDDKVADFPANKMSFREELFVDFKIENLLHTAGTKISQAQRIQLTIHPKKDVVLHKIELTYSRSFSPTEKVFCNGFQSWSESRLYSLEERLPAVRSIAKPFMGNYGDYHMPDLPRQKGQLHSWTYGYIQGAKAIEFLGSLREQYAFTYFVFDKKNNQVGIYKDCKGLELKHSLPILDVVLLKGQEQAVFDTYFDAMNLPAIKAKAAIGWTSWYHYYTDISEAIILKNLAAFAKINKEIATTENIIFQIDDGYQERVGDWLAIKDSFPNGMQPIASAIHKEGFKAGLWLAPFICEQKSDIYKHKKHWLLKDKKGKAIKGGYNPGWSGDFYALDIYNQEVRDYLTAVFYTIFTKWGYDMVKLDFLYAACIIPRATRTRGQVMYDALSFLRDLAGDKLILGCGVPLGSAFGLVDYCRIGADIHLKWEHQFLKFLRNRERVSTIIALRTVLSRWQLNQRAFINDPDVFILRKAKNKLNPTQQYTILLINTLLGDLLFTSDYLEDYTAEQKAEFLSLFKWKNSQIAKVDLIAFDQYAIHFTNKNNNYIALCNLTSKPVQLPLKKGHLVLEAYESLVIRK